MVGRRKVASRLPPRMYEYKGKRGTTYFARLRDNSRVYLGDDLIEAKKRLIELEGDIPSPGTITELIDDYLREELKPKVKAGKRSARTLADREDQKPNLVAAFGKMQIGDLTPNHVWQYLHKFRGKVAPVRANKEISFLQTCYAWAREQGIIQTNPCEKVTRNEETPRDRLVSDSELDAFMVLARGRGGAFLRAALAFQIAYLTGKGQAQILALKRSQIEADGILFGKRKGGARVFVTWSPTLRTAIDESLAMPSNIESMFVVHNAEGGPYTRDGFKTNWQKLMAAWVAQGGERFTFHDGRAKAATDTIEQGRKASELTGHLTESVVAKVYDRRAVRKSAPVR